MKIYSYYDSATGRIFCEGSEERPDHADLSCVIHEGVGGVGLTHYIEAGELVAMTIKPTPSHTFDYATRQWQDPRTLADQQVRKWAEIKALRDAAEFGPFTYAGHLYQGDVDAQRRLGVYISVSKSAIAAGAPFAAEWTTNDNQQVLLSAADFVAIEMAKASQVAAAFAHAVTLRAAIHAPGATIESVEAVTW